MATDNSGLVTFIDGYMKKMLFADGQILQDFHLNTMQDNFSEAIKIKTTKERYDLLMLLSPYTMYFSEDFTSNTYRDTLSTADRNEYTYSISSGSWISKYQTVPSSYKVNEIYILSNMEETLSLGATVRVSYRTSSSGSYQVASLGVPISFSSARSGFQIKIECLYTSTVRPTVSDFCVMWR